VVGIGIRYSIIVWSDLHSELDLRTLFLLRLSAIFKIALGVNTIMLMILVMSLISLLCTSLTLQSKTYSLAEVCILISTLLVIIQIALLTANLLIKLLYLNDIISRVLLNSPICAKFDPNNFTIQRLPTNRAVWALPCSAFEQRRFNTFSMV